MAKIVIIGAGLCGLSCAYHLNSEYLLLEKEEKVGGLCRSETRQGFVFDYSGHLLHLHNPYTKKLIAKLLAGNLLEHRRSAWINSHSIYTRYPFQANTYGLSKKVVWECLSGMIKAQCKFSTNQNVPSFYDWILNNFGEGIARHFMVPYNEKLWTVHPAQLTCEWLYPFVVRPNIKDVIKGGLLDNRQSFGYNAGFFYPQAGGIEVLPGKMAERIKNLVLNKQVVEVNTQKKYLLLNDGTGTSYDKLVSTMPLPELLGVLTDLPAKIQRLAGKLAWTSVLNVNLGISRPNITDKHWIYFPEKKYIFYRAGFSSNFSQSICPPGASAIYTEVSYRPEKKLNKEKTLGRIIAGLRSAKILKKNDQILTTQFLDIPYAYVLYNRQRTPAVKVIQEYLQSKNIYSIGRYGGWEYSYMEEAILQGRELAERLDGV